MLWESEILSGVGRLDSSGRAIVDGQEETEMML